MGRSYPDRIAVVLDKEMERSILAELKGMPNEAKKAAETAARKTLKTAETRLVRNYAKNVNLKRDEIGKRIVIKRKPTTQVPSGLIEISGSRIPLWKFSLNLGEFAGFATQRGKKIKERTPKRGASWKIYKQADKKVSNKNFFVAEGRKDNKIQIFKRRDDAKGGKNAKAPQDYRTAFGVSLAWADKQRNIVAPVLKDVREILRKNLLSQVDRFLQRKKSDRA